MLTIETNQTTYGARLVTTQPYAANQLIQAIKHYRLIDRPTYQSIQVDANRHIEDLDVIAYLNHSCQPNVIVDTTTLTISAAHAIATGEELTFFYPSTEWAMARPFICQCGARHCLRLVAGAKYLAVDRLAQYFINHHIREMVMQALSPVVVRPDYCLPSYTPVLSAAA